MEIGKCIEQDVIFLACLEILISLTKEYIISSRAYRTLFENLNEPEVTAKGLKKRGYELSCSSRLQESKLTAAIHLPLFGHRHQG